MEEKVMYWEDESTLRIMNDLWKEVIELRNIITWIERMGGISVVVTDEGSVVSKIDPNYSIPLGVGITTVEALKNAMEKNP